MSVTLSFFGFLIQFQFIKSIIIVEERKKESCGQLTDPSRGPDLVHRPCRSESTSFTRICLSPISKPPNMSPLFLMAGRSSLTAILNN
jgi:hypothetical protein